MPNNNSEFEKCKPETFTAERLCTAASAVHDVSVTGGFDCTCRYHIKSKYIFVVKTNKFTFACLVYLFHCDKHDYVLTER